MFDIDRCHYLLGCARSFSVLATGKADKADKASK